MEANTIESTIESTTESIYTPSQLFKKTRDKYNLHKKSNKQTTTTCSHQNTVDEGSSVICIECGHIVKETITHDIEWKCYGGNDGNASCVQMRKIEEKGIRKDVENMGFSDSIIDIAEQLYFKVVGNTIYRGETRKGVIFACFYHTYNDARIFQMPSVLRNIFNISVKTTQKGMKIVNEHAPKSLNIHTVDLELTTLIRFIMSKFSTTDKQVEEVIQLYHQVDECSSMLNRSRDLSVACSIVYYWIRTNNIHDITLSKYSDKVGTSDITINKIAKEIARLLGNTNF